MQINCIVSKSSHNNYRRSKNSNYRTGAIITRGLYFFNPLFEGQQRFFKDLILRKILALCMVSIQERGIMVRVR
jgi:hypothetical protein